MTRRRRFAETWRRARGEGPALGRSRVGRFILRPSQAVAVRRVLRAFELHGGALLADPPGAGKTIVALTVAQALASSQPDAPCAVVVAPAALRAQWERSARRADVPVTFMSMEAMSRDAPLPSTGHRLVIVDEAHHARSPRTRRYARLVTLCAGARVLLLSATPVVNRIADREAMLALFRSHDGLRERADASAPWMIRREAESERNPAIRRLRPLTLEPRPCHARIGVLLAELPPPLPASDGRAALALIRISLAMAWTSSLAALDAALRRRLQRGEALADLLAAGAAPSKAALSQWIVGDDATQLAFAALFATAPSRSSPDASAHRVLSTHLAAVRALRAVVHPHVEPDRRERAASILAQLHADPAERLVVFARQAETIRALWSELRHVPGAVAILGDRTLAAQGSWQRDEVLALVGPRAKPLRDGDPRAVRLLLATDLLAEGVELQGIGRLVHADRAWTPATIEQREGRIARGSRREVIVTRFAAPPEAVPLLRLGRRLLRKEHARRLAVRGAACLERADAIVSTWLAARPACEGTDGAARPATDDLAPSADAFLAAIAWRAADPEEARIEFLAGERYRAGWRIAGAPCALARVAGRPEAHLGPADLADIRRAISRWLRQRSTKRLAGSGAESTARADTRWRALRRRVDAVLRTTPIALRAARAARLETAMRRLQAGGGAAVERALGDLLAIGREAGDAAFEAALVALVDRLSRGPRRAPARERPALVALVAASGPARLAAPSRAPTSASPGTAVPR